MERVAELTGRIVGNVEKVIVGKRAEVEMALIGLICQGHLLIEDVPGVGKTVLAKAFAKSIGCSFRRIQFTPDLLPSDVTGVSVFSQKTGEFEFRPGPIMAQIVLADEINRATPKTQSALLECMEERQITVDGVTRRMPVPFLVMATQNPIEYEGTFPLPEAQLDRFMMRIRLGYPRRGEEVEILGRQKEAHPIDTLGQTVSVEELLELQGIVRRQVEVSPLVREYIVALVSSTRQHPEVYLGASPRGSLALFRGSQARAALQGREFAIPDDVKALAVPTLAHRLILSPSARIRSISAQDVVNELLQSIAVPGAMVSA
ncbi:MAG: MoxR family ATPase [Chloroflexi bacterium]|nr:MoxR family ATPase [Chloroflexota bacterium]MCL5111002.1 MoxR family ATPase [Chloroflexota bacterium]